MATYVDCRDRLTLDEVLDLYEIIMVRHENEYRAMQAAERKAETQRSIRRK